MLLHRTLLTLTLVAAINSPAFAEDYKGPPIRLYLFTALTEGGFVDEDSKARTDALTDLRKRLKDSKWVTLVEAKDQAQATLEILSRNAEKTGDYRQSSLNANRANAVKAYTVRAKFTVGTYETELTGDTEASWGKRRAAGELGARLEEWIKKNGNRVQ